MYTEKGSHLAFFTPLITLAQNAAEVMKEMDIGAASADHGELVCVRACRVYKLMFTLTSEAASGTTTAPVVIFTKRPTPLSASGEVVVDTLTIPSGTAIGKTVYLEIEPVSFAVGDSMELSWTVGVGTPTGQGVYSFECIEEPEEAANNSDMIESAQCTWPLVGFASFSYLGPLIIKLEYRRLEYG